MDSDQFGMNACNKQICFRCVEDEYLSAEIQRKGKKHKCSYCGGDHNSYSLKELADRVETAFNDHYRKTSDQPSDEQWSMLADSESDYDFEREGMPVVEAIEQAAQIPHQAAEDIQGILNDRYYDLESSSLGEETEFADDSYYEEKGVSSFEWADEWDRFEQSLKSEARFFSQSAAAHLASVFGGIDQLKVRGGRSLVVDAGPEHELNHLYRARVFQSDPPLKEALCYPDRYVGSPPARLANAGRMNARGISVFYGATEAEVAISEVRPPVGSKVVVAKFLLTRPLRLLDLTRISEVYDKGSVFDPTWIARLERAAFLRTLGNRMTKPVMPDDEAFEYLATQAIADFLATENDPRLDGIVFRSVQAGKGSNIVLFQKASGVELRGLPEGSTVEAHFGDHTEDGWEPDYCVFEELPAKKKRKASVDQEAWFPLQPEDSAFFSPEKPTTLKIDLDSIHVHEVDSVEYRTTSHKVRRHSSTRRPRKF